MMCIATKQWNDCVKLGIDALRLLLKELSYDKVSDKAEIVKVLGKIGNPQSLDAILNAMNQAQWEEDKDEAIKIIRYGQRS